MPASNDKDRKCSVENQSCVLNLPPCDQAIQRVPSSQDSEKEADAGSCVGVSSRPHGGGSCAMIRADTWFLNMLVSSLRWERGAMPPCTMYTRCPSVASPGCELALNLPAARADLSVAFPFPQL